MPARSHRSYADDVRARTDEELSELIRMRPDLARPIPANLSALAARAATVPSTRRALEQLDAGQLHALEALLVGGSAEAAAELLGVGRTAVQPALQDLWRRGLAWQSPDGLRTARAVGESLTHPAGLGPPAAELGVRLPADITGAVDALEVNATRVLDRLRWGVPRASFAGTTMTAVRDRLVAAGLMARLDDGDGVLPREVGLALRGGRLHERPLDPPAAGGVVVRAADDVDASAGAEALELLSHVEELARAWEAEPPRVLRSGGLSVKDHKAVAGRLDVSLGQAAFAIEIASATGLFATDGEVEPSWLPTPAYDDWRARPPGTRWAHLVATWWRTNRAPALVGQRLDGRPVNALSEQAAWPVFRQRRQDVVGALASLPQGAAPSLDLIEDLLRWQRPLRLPSGAPTHAGEVLQEAAWLGVTGRGALSAVGHGLREGLDVDGLAEVASAHLPEPVDHVLVQADLTAVAPGPLNDELARLMRTSADIESRGGATVFRFTPHSVRRALDSGMSSDELLTTLRTASLTPLPQPLEYLVLDVARRHGHARVGAVGCYVRSDDETALAAMLADRDLAPLQLRRIAPTVLVSPVAASTALQLLREHSPVAETSDGGLVLARRDTRRAKVRRSPVQAVTVDEVDDAAIADLLMRLREREQQDTDRLAAQRGPVIPETDATVSVTMLADAAAERAAVWIGYVDETGAVRRALFRPERVSGGRAIGSVDDAPGRRTFTIHRITGVAPA